MAESKKLELAPWSDEQVAFMKALFEDRKTSTDIAAAMNRKFGLRLTRNAVCGKLSRLGLKRLTPEIITERKLKAAFEARKRAQRERSPRPHPKKVAEKVPTVAPTPVGPVRDFSHHGTCKWIYGDPGLDWQACGHPSRGVYCAYHRRLSVSSDPKPVSSRDKQEGKQSRARPVLFLRQRA